VLDSSFSGYLHWSYPTARTSRVNRTVQILRLLETREMRLSAGSVILAKVASAKGEAKLALSVDMVDVVLSISPPWFAKEC